MLKSNLIQYYHVRVHLAYGYSDLNAEPEFTSESLKLLELKMKNSSYAV